MTWNRLTIEVMGDSYTIKCSADARDRLKQAAKQLNSVCDTVQQGDVSISRDKVLVVAALNLASIALAAQHEQQQLGQKVGLLNEKINLID